MQFTSPIMSLSVWQDIPALLDDVINAQVFEGSRDCIMILKPDGTITRINPAGTLALELERPGEHDGTAWAGLWPDSERERIEHALDDARHGRPGQFLGFGPTLQNSPRWWDVLVTPMSGQPPTIRRLLVMARDITELVQVRELAAQANACRVASLAMLAHELRNPLSALEMAAVTLQSGAMDPAAPARLGQMIARQVGHMSRLVEDLLDASRLVRGQVSLRTEHLDLREVLTHAQEQLASVLAGRRQQVHMAVPSSPAPFVGDRTRLMQVFGNLLGNAARYSPAGATIHISLTLDEEEATVRVADRGQGMSSDMLPKLFDMYWQGQDTPDRRLAGVGLGLAIVKGMVELHGGTVEAASPGFEKGSIFTVRLPLGPGPCRPQ